jgi:hypothetical protein
MIPSSLHAQGSPLDVFLLEYFCLACMERHWEYQSAFLTHACHRSPGGLFKVPVDVAIGWTFRSAEPLKARGAE